MPFRYSQCNLVNQNFVQGSFTDIVSESRQTFMYTNSLLSLHMYITTMQGSQIYVQR
jgi:hypothetical protein